MITEICKHETIAEATRGGRGGGGAEGRLCFRSDNAFGVNWGSFFWVIDPNGLQKDLQNKYGDGKTRPSRQAAPRHQICLLCSTFQCCDCFTSVNE